MQWKKNDLTTGAWQHNIGCPYQYCLAFYFWWVLNKDTFEIINNNFTTTDTDSDDIENPDLKGLDTSVERQQGVQTCDLIGTVNAALLDCVNKAEKQKSQQRPWKKNELNNLKKVFDAASA